MQKFFHVDENRCTSAIHSFARIHSDFLLYDKKIQSNYYAIIFIIIVAAADGNVVHILSVHVYYASETKWSGANKSDNNIVIQFAVSGRLCGIELWYGV